MPDELPRRPGFIRVPCPGAGSVPVSPTRESGMVGPHCPACGQAVDVDEGVVAEHKRYEKVT